MNKNGYNNIKCLNVNVDITIGKKINRNKIWYLSIFLKLITKNGSIIIWNNDPKAIRKSHTLSPLLKDRILSIPVGKGLTKPNKILYIIPKGKSGVKKIILYR